MKDDSLQNSDLPKVGEKEALLQRRDDHLFMAEMEEILKRAEETRIRFMDTYLTRKLITTAAMIVFISGGAAGFVWFLLINGNLHMALLCIATGLFVPVLMGPWKNLAISAYKADHKRNFLPAMAAALGGLKYFPLRGISAKIIQKTGVILPYGAYEAEDCFMGLYKGVKVIFSEARLFRDKKKQHPMFRGLFVLLELPSPAFEGHTIITSDVGLIGTEAHTRWSSLAPVALPKDNTEWSRFQVFSNKPEAAARQVNEAFLKEFVEASNIFGHVPLSAVMFGGKFVFMSIPHEEDMFEASDMHIPVTFRAYIDKCRRELSQILELIDIIEMYKKG